MVLRIYQACPLISPSSPLNVNVYLPLPHNVAYFVKLSLVREPVDLLSPLVDALAHDLPSGGPVLDPPCSGIVGHHRVGEALLATLESKERLTRLKEVRGK